MAAYIYYDSISKPRFRSDLPRPIDALKLFETNQYNSLSIVGQAGIEAVKNGNNPAEFEIFHNRQQMLAEQDFIVFVREGAVVIPAWVMWVAVGVSVATSIYSIVMANKLKTPSNVNRTQESATNRIQGRENQPRLNQRVERIYGEVRAFPADMMKSYIVYEKDEQIEYACYCIGQGEYGIDDVRDGNTLGRIMGGGWSASFYQPFSDLIDDKPYHNIGSVVGGGVLRTTFESNEAVFDEIDPPNDNSIYIPSFSITGSMATHSAKLSVKDTKPGYSLRDHFVAGEYITFTDLYLGWRKENPITLHNPDGSVYPCNQWELLNASLDSEGKIKYLISRVEKDFIVIDIDEQTTNADVVRAWYSSVDFSMTYFVSVILIGYKYQFWVIDDPDIDGKQLNATIDGVKYYTVGKQTDIITRIDKIGSYAVGPFAGVDNTYVQVNISSDGIYAIDANNNTHSIQVVGRIVCRELDDNNEQTGRSNDTHWSIMSNSINTKKQIGITVDVVSTYKKYTIEVVRDTERDKDWQGSWVDVVNLEALYFYKNNAPRSFGDKTLVITQRRQSSFGVGRPRKLSLLATSKLKINGTMKLSRFFDEIICDAAADPLFGRRSPETVAQMRIDLRAARDELIAYFGREDVAYFDYCVDSENITFENFVRMVANAVFCTPYLKSTLRFSPDIDQPIDTMIFGHANKLIADEELKFSFDDLQAKKYDCVEVKWRNPDNMDSQEIFFIPTQGSNPKTIDLTGVRDKRRATIHAWREWNRIRYQRYSYEFTAGLEATQMIPNQRIGIVNNVCANSLDGYVRAWDGGVNLLLSQEADLSSGGYKIALQNPQGGIGIFDAAQGRDLHHVVLNEAPTFHVNAHLSENLTVYRIAKEDELTRDSYQTQELELANSGGVKVRSVNYAPEVYSKDLE